MFDPPTIYSPYGPLTNISTRLFIIRFTHSLTRLPLAHLPHYSLNLIHPNVFRLSAANLSTSLPFK